MATSGSSYAPPPAAIQRAPKDRRLQPAADAIQIMTMKVGKGLEFPVVALHGVGRMPAAGEDGQEAARAIQKLVIAVSGDGKFGSKLDR